MIRIKDLPDNTRCPHCGSQVLGLLKVEEEIALALAEKKGQKLTKNEEKLQTQALQTGQLISKYGKTAAIALSARELNPATFRISLKKNPSSLTSFMS